MEEGDENQPSQINRRVNIVRGLVDKTNKMGSIESVQEMTKALKRRSERIAAERSVAESMFIDAQVHSISSN